jgi:hypothetical protein
MAHCVCPEYGGVWRCSWLHSGVSVWVGLGSREVNSLKAMKSPQQDPNTEEVNEHESVTTSRSFWRDERC